MESRTMSSRRGKHTESVAAPSVHDCSIPNRSLAEAEIPQDVASPTSMPLVTAVLARKTRGNATSDALPVTPSVVALIVNVPPARRHDRHCSVARLTKLDGRGGRLKVNSRFRMIARPDQWLWRQKCSITATTSVCRGSERDENYIGKNGFGRTAFSAPVARCAPYPAEGAKQRRLIHGCDCYVRVTRT